MRGNSLEKKNKEGKLNLIMNVAEKIFVEKGYEKATMTEIAKRANLAKGTLYLYFSSKKDLYFTSVERALSALLASIIKKFSSCKNGFEKVVSMGETYVSFSLEYVDYYKLILNYETLEVHFGDKDPHVKKAYEKSEEIFRLLVSSVEEGIKDGSIDERLEPLKIAMVLWSEITGMVQQVSLRETLYEKWTGLKPLQIYEYYIEVTKKMLASSL
ncbi:MULTISPECIES: TetR/AcrR family transcriptional regulator [Petrotoga]|uniref:TetR family transcriptional regulator n=2 Tax=Petrotoga sibirica TaxID=156202 RepID=A0A4R8F2Q8_9BACT|nr:MULTISPECIES: TetR/AcrR family transcriptional regulator [Petrotoga]POZ88867.1 hypothetical protein AA80_04645 [Petrotoga sibirica DSM 13575]POZ90985.1 hypothetical protein AD60_05450 [Petrotoga sp. SL27]TDX17495.1 TetR family transcriptional regulator [Petrotoga sibirica]